MFEKASRMKLRFPYRGQCSVEDLWDLDVRELDTVFKTLNRQAEDIGEESLLNTVSEADQTLQLQIEIIKTIVAIKLAEKDERNQRMAKSARKKQLMAIIEHKQESELHNLSVEDLQKLVNEL